CQQFFEIHGWTSHYALPSPVMSPIIPRQTPDTKYEIRPSTTDHRQNSTPSRKDAMAQHLFRFASLRPGVLALSSYPEIQRQAAKAQRRNTFFDLRLCVLASLR